MTLAATPYVVLLGVLFGTTLIASRFSVGQYPPTNYVVLRLIIAGSAHLLVYLLTRRRIPKDPKVWFQTGVVGLTMAFTMIALVSAMQYQSSGLTSIMITTGPALTVVFAHFVLPDERLNWRKSIGVGIALTGAAALALLGESGLPDIREASPLGYGLTFLALISGSTGDVYLRKNLKNQPTFDVASLRMGWAVLFLLPFTLFFVGFDLSRVDVRGIFALGYAAVVGTFLGMLLSVYILQRFGATPTAMTAYIIPMITATGGMLVLEETITSGMIFGMILILLGIGILNRAVPQENDTQDHASSR